MNLYFEKEIKSRMEAIAKLSLKSDSIIDPKKIDTEINNFILLSKDVENLGASVNKANSFFNVISKRYNLNEVDFVKLSTGMHVNDIASTLKQNELNLFNQLIFKYSPTGLPLFTAQ